jgi:hypothetical protein
MMAVSLLTPLAPVCRVDHEMFSGSRFHPAVENAAAWKNKRVNASLRIYHGHLKVTIERSGCCLMPFHNYLYNTRAAIV